LTVNTIDDELEYLFCRITSVLEVSSLVIVIDNPSEWTVGCVVLIKYPSFQKRGLTRPYIRIIEYQVCFRVPIPSGYPVWPGDVTVLISVRERMYSECISPE
jgi:hypothetical protein